MSLSADQLYALLPAIYRSLDTENGGPLQALFSVIAGQSAILEDNIQQLYDDQFIETCAPWVIPYIGDLVGSNTIYEISGVATGRRAEVANTIGYRRRKGTLLCLEQVAMDVSGLPAAAVEFFKRLITTECMHFIRPHHETTVDLRHGLQLERVDTAFDILNRTIEVRRIAPRVRMVSDPDPAPLDINLHGGGRFNIPDVGVYLWRWKPFSVVKSPVFQVDAVRYMFSPLGQNMPLFSNPPARASFSSLTTRLDVPQPILRREFYKHLEDFYGLTKSILLYADGLPLDASQICCRNLSDCPDHSWGCTPSGMVAIDPVLGRIQFAPDYPPPQQLQSSYTYGFPANIGGGMYDRTLNLPQFDYGQFDLIVVVGSAEAPTLQAAIAGWNALPPDSQGMIILPAEQGTFATLDVDLTGSSAIVLPPQSQLWILAGQPDSSATNPYVFDDCCVVLRGNIDVQAQSDISSGGIAVSAGQLSISGVWISGSLQILGDAEGDAACVQLTDCTLVPGIALERCGNPANPGAPSIVASAAEVTLGLTGCITGPVGNFEGGSTRIVSSIVDSGSRCGVAYAAQDFASQGADLHIEESTVIGKVHVRTMELASNVIFLARRARNDSWPAALWCSRQQVGCVRFCFLPASAITPQQFHCLPPSSSLQGAFEPQFITLRYGHPSYGLLSGDTPMAIWTGADNGSQIGVYYILQETEAVRNVQLRAQEYVPFGLETGIFLEPSRPIVITRPRSAYGYGYGFAGDWNPCGDLDEDDLRFVGVGAALI
jgi:hypothetical protein